MPVTANAPQSSEDELLNRFPQATITQSPPAPSITTQYHPFIEGLLKSLPAESEPWPIERRAKWLEAASNIFDLIYGGGTGNILIAVEPATGNGKGEP